VIVATAGLCVHALADGVALGASFYRKSPLRAYLLCKVTFSDKAKSSLGVSVMIALIIHKIPEAFGFGSYLAVKNTPR
jgi:zinc transporter ZupT